MAAHQFAWLYALITDHTYGPVGRDFPDGQTGSGVVEFSSGDDMEWALKNLDGKKLKTHLSDEA